MPLMPLVLNRAVFSSHDAQSVFTGCDAVSLYALDRVQSSKFANCQRQNLWCPEHEINSKIASLIKNNHSMVIGVDLSPRAVRSSLDKFCTLGIVTTALTTTIVRYTVYKINVDNRNYIINVNGSKFKTANKLLDVIFDSFLCEFDCVEHFTNASEIYKRLLREVVGGTADDLETVYEQRVTEIFRGEK